MRERGSVREVGRYVCRRVGGGRVGGEGVGGWGGDLSLGTAMPCFLRTKGGVTWFHAFSSFQFPKLPKRQRVTISACRNGPSIAYSL